jgi:plasmid maintenance system killer protein
VRNETGCSSSSVVEGDTLFELAGRYFASMLRGRCSIRINDRVRVVFTWRSGVAADVELVDYHR